MSKQRERNELEYLRSENRRLKSENRHLRKEIGRLTKKSHQYSELEELAKDIEAEKEFKSEKSPSCPKCGKHSLMTLPLGEIRIIYTCKNCDYRKTEKYGKA